MYVLVRTDGKYVAKPGQHHSYTLNLENARIFPTKEDAEKDRCTENERIVSLNQVLGIN